MLKVEMNFLSTASLWCLKIFAVNISFTWPKLRFVVLAGPDEHADH